MRSIFQKIYLLVVVIIFCLLSITTFLNVKNGREALFEEMGKRALAHSRTLQVKCKYAITVIDRNTCTSFIDRQSVHTFIEDIRQHEADIQRALIIDRDGMVLSSLNKNEIDTFLPEFVFNSDRKVKTEPAIQWLPEEKKLSITSDIIIDGISMGTTIVQFSLKGIEDEVDAITIRAFVTGILFLLGGAIFASPIVRTIARPVQQLNHYAGEIAKGKLDYNLDIRSHDEVGQLASSFRHMTLTLKQTLADLNGRMAELKNSERSLRHSEKKYRDIFDNAVEGIFQITSAGHVVTANNAFLAMFGFLSEQEVTAATNITDYLLHSKDRHSMLAILDDSGEIKDMEVTLKRQDGTVFTALVNARVAYLTHENIKIIDGRLQDITARKEKEHAIREMEYAENANRTKSVFLSNMSHELRTPLNAILGYTQIFAGDSSLTAKQKDGINVIHQSGHHLLMLINDILDLSKVESGKMELNENDFPLANFLDGIKNSIKGRANDKNIAFHYEPDGPLPLVITADELRLRQVLLNLLSNAVKFTDSGFCALKVKARPAAKDNVILTFKVEDSGGGIPPDMHKIIFQPFQQTGDRLKYSEGSGLGLGISRKLVELMGATLELTSPLHKNLDNGTGAGCCFSFSIKVPASEDLAESVQTVSQITGYSHSGSDNSAKKILIVYDKESNQKVMRAILESFSFVVEELENGVGIFEACCRFRPDAILMDLQMPEKDGFTACLELKGYSEHSEIPVIAVTSSTANDTILCKKCFERGFSGFLTRPIVIPELMECLAGLIEIELQYSEIPGHDTISPADSSDFVVPAQEILERFLILGNAGDVTGIVALNDEVAAMESGKYILFSDKISTMADNFQLIEMGDFITLLCENR